MARIPWNKPWNIPWSVHVDPLPKPYCDKPRPHHKPPSCKPVQYPHRNSTVSSGKGTLGTLGHVERDWLLQSSQSCRSPGRTLEPEERKNNPQHHWGPTKNNGIFTIPGQDTRSQSHASTQSKSTPSPSISHTLHAAVPRSSPLNILPTQNNKHCSVHSQ